MELIETKIGRIYVSNNCVTYGFMVDCKKGYAYTTINYSKESDFMSNYFGASRKLKLNKTAYLTLTSEGKILSISNAEGDTLIPEAYGYYEFGRVETKNDEYINNVLNMSVEEYTEKVENEIKGKILVK